VKLLDSTNKKAKKNMLIQKIICSTGSSYDKLKNLSVSELNKTLKEIQLSSHPHSGCGSLKWKNCR